MSGRRHTAVIAAGGSAGHIEPGLALADALVAADPPFDVLMLGTSTGLEQRIVPARGHRLAAVPRVPLPRRPRPELFSVPWRLGRAIRVAGQILDAEAASVVIGFGGYVCVPTYLAARRRGIPIVVHEANARAGIANRIGARLTPYVAVANAESGLPGAQVTGIPLRGAIVGLDRVAQRPTARAFFGLAGDGPVLLVTGGSQGARHINDAVVDAAGALAAADVQVLHHAGLHNAATVQQQVAQFPTHHVVAYIEQMDLAYAAADLLLGRSGAMTCAEVGAVGLPAAFVPLPIGNGEQRLNAMPLVRAGGALLVDDIDLDGRWIVDHLLPVLSDPAALAAMSRAVRTSAATDPVGALVAMVQAASEKMAR